MNGTTEKQDQHQQMKTAMWPLDGSPGTFLYHSNTYLYAICMRLIIWIRKIKSTKQLLLATAS